MLAKSSNQTGSRGSDRGPARILREVSLFAKLSDEALEAIGSLASVKSYRKNTVIVEQGDETDSLYVVVSGKVKVYVSIRSTFGCHDVVG